MTSDMLISTFPGKDLFKEDKNRKLWNPILNRSKESPDEEDGNAAKSKTSCTKELILVDMENDSRLVWCAKLREELVIWLR